MTRRRLTVCVVAMNEADRIRECLESTAFADEWIVVDSHSTDDTRAIAAAFGARVIERDWPGWVEQKNFAIDQASSDWVLCLDADECVSPRLRESIEHVLEGDDTAAGFEFARLTRYMGRWIRHGGWYPDRKLRLFRRAAGRFEGRSVHERVKVDGRVDRLDGDLLHDPYRSLSDHLRRIDLYTTLAARDKRAHGRHARLSDIVLRPGGKFVRMYLLKAGFLDGLPGFIIAVTGAFYVFCKYAKLWASK